MPAQLQATALILFEARQYGVYILQLFFGLHLPVLGYMIINSDLFGGSNSVSSQMAASSLYSILEK